MAYFTVQIHFLLWAVLPLLFHFNTPAALEKEEEDDVAPWTMWQQQWGADLSLEQASGETVGICSALEAGKTSSSCCSFREGFGVQKLGPFAPHHVQGLPVVCVVKGMNWGIN